MIVTLPIVGIYNEAYHFPSQFHISTTMHHIFNAFQTTKTTYLLPDFLLKVLISSNVQTDTAVFQPLCLDFVARTGYGADYDIRLGQDFLESQGAGVHDVTRVVTGGLGFPVGRLPRSFGIFLK